MRRISGNNKNEDINNSIMDESQSLVMTEKENSIIYSKCGSNRDSYDNDYGYISNNNITINSVLPRNIHHSQPKIHKKLKNNQILSELRKSYDSSLMFESQNEQTLTKIMEKKESFTQVKVKMSSIVYNNTETEGNA